MSNKKISKKKAVVYSKKIGILPNLHPGEEPLRYCTDIQNLKNISKTLLEYFLGFVHPHETLKVLLLSIGSIIYVLF
jgi:hypothetical protein